MSEQKAKGFSFVVPMVLTLVMEQIADGAVQIGLTVIAAVATTLFVYLMAHFVWAPVLKRFGIWWSSLLLGFAIIAVGLASAVGGLKMANHRGKWDLSQTAAIVGLLFSWALAAIRGSQDGEESRLSPDPRLIRSRLLRGRRRALP